MNTLSYVWGSEEILWGYDLSHKYTLKLLKPRAGKIGCLSLQSHEQKEESWVGLSGLAWGLYATPTEDSAHPFTIKTKVLYPGNCINLPCGTIHRLMGLSNDCAVFEASTLDQNAADTTKPKDIIRYHCVHGRPVFTPGAGVLKDLIDTCITLTNEAIIRVEQGLLPLELEL